jgi:hypothetical protein
VRGMDATETVALRGATGTVALRGCNRDGCVTGMQPRRSRYGDATETVALRGATGTVALRGATGTVALRGATGTVALLLTGMVELFGRFDFVLDFM